MIVFEANTADRAMRMAAYHLLNECSLVASRAGETREATMAMIRIERPCEREIISPSRKASIAAQIAETMWVLAGRSDVEWLSHYLPRAKDFSDDGVKWRAGYGPRLRNWQAEMSSDGHGTDQLAEVIGLLREDPMTRRAVMSIFDPAVDYADSKDIPCNNWLHFLARDGKLDLHVATRSNDLIWGWSGINAFEWSVLLEIVASMTGLRVGQMYFSISSLHLYSQHFKRAGGIVEDAVLNQQPKPSPRFIPPYPVALDSLIAQWFAVEKMIRTGALSVDLAIESFPEPMMQSWLRVLHWWWTGDTDHLAPLRGTRLWVAAHNGVQPKRQPTRAAHHAPGLVEYAVNLHAEKHAVYGDSWKRRGEVLGIQANIARKVDRLGVPGAGDTDLDTAVDLWIYCAKYLDWMQAQRSSVPDVPELDRVYCILGRALPESSASLTELIEHARETFERLIVAPEPPTVSHLLQLLLHDAHRLAQHYWDEKCWRDGNATRSWKGYGDE